MNKVNYDDKIERNLQTKIYRQKFTIRNLQQEIYKSKFTKRNL